jgi:Protein of unknown function (DUF1572)
MSLESEFLNFSADKLLELAGRIEICARKLTPEQVWLRASENDNAIGNLLLHLNGNVRQWILHGVGGQPDRRDRDSEFLARTGDPEALLTALRATVADAAAIIRAFPAERLLERILPQNYDVSVMEAVYHVVEHFAGHAFQIFLLTKMFTAEDLGFYAHLNGPGLSSGLPSVSRPFSRP